MYIEKKRTSLYYIALLFFLIFKINLNECNSKFCNSSIGVAKHLNYEGRNEQACNNDIVKRGYIKSICKPPTNNNNRIRNRKLNNALTIETYANEPRKNGQSKKSKYHFLSNQHNIVKNDNNIGYKNWKMKKISRLNYSDNNINVTPISGGENDTNLIRKKWQLRKKNTNIPIYLMANADATVMDINVSPDISSHIETDRTRQICIKPVENNTPNKLKSNDDDQKIQTNKNEKNKKKQNSTKRVLSEESKKSMKEKLRSIMIKKWKDADFRKKMIKSFKKRGAHHNKKISDSIKNKWKNDKDYKLKTLEGQRKYFIKKCKNNNAVSSKTREKISRSMKLYWQSKNKYRASQPNNLQSIVKKKKQKKVWENIYSIILNKNVNDFNNYQTFHHNLSINLQAALG
ncbi:conserved Plasmodium protein, unknown function [Plasmodium vinckei vinckei]|uniref:Uncharacterized protein n=1 Tax=Plasmodium vinckei vinckei TaxID=54757 RepID=A0A449BTT0_PLAVN|nr:conserved Plasmodium protein, unknown function [Plasmodium vinckei vinckei]KEG03000.1 hypothetical protein YYE_01931 [Plasmodium vinckei vinckei]VEV56802.1 conserved Plasmodium protein, unknown function [Plasmodium vinckei vinckei]